MIYLVSVLIGYFFGTIPFGLLFTQFAGMGDIRQIGSGNIGATNVLRTGRKDLALLTLIFDVSKAGLVALITEAFFSNPFAGLCAGTAAVIGHNFPVWLKFKGGKGVASTLGLMLATNPVVGVLTCLTWLLTALLFKYSSLAALSALVLAPFFALILGGNNAYMYALFYALLAVLSFWRHKTNISRLLNKTEPQIKIKKE